LEILGGDMTEDVIQRIAMLEETLQLAICVQSFAADTQAPGSRQLEYSTVGPGHHFHIHPFPEPAAAVVLHLHVRSRGDPRKNIPYINVMDNIQVTEYLGYRPFIVGRPETQLLFRETKERLCAGLHKFGPVQQFRYQTLLVKNCHGEDLKAYR
jgi:hypothetical protein